jgi:hypothetical protein
MNPDLNFRFYKKRKTFRSYIVENLHQKTISVGPPENLFSAPTDRKRFPELIYLLTWPKNLQSQKIWSVFSKPMSFLRQRTKSVETKDFSVKPTDKSVLRTILGRLEHKPNFSGTTDFVFRSRVFPTYFC